MAKAREHTPHSSFFVRTISGARSASRRYPRELWKSLRGLGPIPAWPTPAQSIADSLARLDRTDFAACWLGHAGTLLRINDELILTDPVLSDRIGPRIAGRSFGLGRLQPAPLGPRDLPPLRTILISHAHFDHLDRPTLRGLASPDITVITAPGTRSLIPQGFGRIFELDWGKTFDIGSAKITAIRPNHWGARTALDRSRGYNSYLIESTTARARRILFGGDSAMTHAFDNLKVDLAIMGIGGYQPWVHAHATPEQVWDMVDRMRADRILPMHHSTFPLSEEPVDEPLERLLNAAGKSADRIAALLAGEIITE